MAANWKQLNTDWGNFGTVATGVAQYTQALNNYSGPASATTLRNMVNQLIDIQLDPSFMSEVTAALSFSNYPSVTFALNVPVWNSPLRVSATQQTVKTAAGNSTSLSNLNFTFQEPSFIANNPMPVQEALEYGYSAGCNWLPQGENSPTPNNLFLYWCARATPGMYFPYTTSDGININIFITRCQIPETSILTVAGTLPVLDGNGAPLPYVYVTDIQSPRTNSQLQPLMAKYFGSPNVAKKSLFQRLLNWLRRFFCKAYFVSQ